MSIISSGTDVTWWQKRRRLITHQKSNPSSSNAKNLKSLAFYNIPIYTFTCCEESCVSFPFYGARILQESSTKHHLALNIYFDGFNIWEIRTAAGACPVLRREQLITAKSLLSTACGRSWTELYYNKGRYKQCQISSAAITVIGLESRDWSPQALMVHDVDTQREGRALGIAACCWGTEKTIIFIIWPIACLITLLHTVR